MSEFSIEEKANRYDEAIEKLHEIITMDNKPVNPKEIGEYLFPELKESEDEQIRKEDEDIRKWLISQLEIKSDMNNSCELELMILKSIAWLEKQDKQNSNILWHDVSEEPEEQRELFCKWKGYADNIWHDVAFYHLDDKAFWNGERPIEDVTKWAYVDEIIKD